MVNADEVAGMKVGPGALVRIAGPFPFAFLPAALF